MIEEFTTEYKAEERNSIFSFWARNARELIKYRHAIYNFAISSLRSKYRRSAFGFLWSLLSPLFTMVILSVVFSTIFKNPLANYSIYIFSGLLPWNMILASMLTGSMCLVVAERYLKKIYIPKIIFPIVIVTVEAINFLLSLISLFFFAIFLGAKISWALLFLPVALLVTTLFLLGLVMFVGMLNVYFRDLQHIVQVVFTGLFYLTPVVYPLELISSNPFLGLIIRFNPILYFVELFHSIIYRSEIPAITTWLTCLGLMIVSLAIGSFVFSNREKDVVYRL